MKRKKKKKLDASWERAIQDVKDLLHGRPPGFVGDVFKPTVEFEKRAVGGEALTRVPVDFRYDALNPEFEKMLAKIASYADDKYGDCHLYAKLPDRLRGEKSPINHIREHLRQYIAMETYDKFDGDLGWHLAAIAYNAMMELHYLRKFGPVQHPLVLMTTHANRTDEFESVLRAEKKPRRRKKKKK